MNLFDDEEFQYMAHYYKLVHDLVVSLLKNFGIKDMTVEGILAHGDALAGEKRTAYSKIQMLIETVGHLVQDGRKLQLKVGSRSKVRLGFIS